MIFGKWTSLVIVWGMMMNIFHPLAHALTADVSPSQNNTVSIVLSISDLSVAASNVHHDEDLGSKHCDVCHISVTAFIMNSVASEIIVQDSEKLLGSFIIPVNDLSSGVDQPPQTFA